jgi:hypothetical protein
VEGHDLFLEPRHDRGQERGDVVHSDPLASAVKGSVAVRAWIDKRVAAEAVLGERDLM